MKVYICGPITGYAEGNRPAFDAAAHYLRSMTPWTVVSPPELDPAVTEGYDDQYWRILGEDLKHVLEADALVLLDGWELSKGAQIEIYVAIKAGKKLFFDFWQGELSTVSVSRIRSSLANRLL